MEIEIKFRGKIIETCYDKNIDGWAIGNYIYDAENDSHIIQLQNLNCQFYVDGNTIGQLVCFDKKGNEVYSNSKIKYFGREYGLKYLTNGWYIDSVSYPNFEEKDIEVIVD